MTITQSFSKLSAVAAGIAIAFALIAGVFATATPANAAALTSAQVSSIIGLLQSFGADAATIANVQASLTGGTPTTPSTGGSTGACPALSRSLQQGSTGADVMALQKFLNATAATQVSVSGAGSPGLESSYFGPATKAAVTKFQTLNNVSAIGIVGPATRAAIAAVCGGTTTNPGTPSGPGITVSAGAQPANALAPEGASRVPFTTFTITNNSGVVQTINGITVERTGLGVDSNLAGIVLVDSTNNVQIGVSKTLNSNHQAVIGDSFTINPGETKTLTVAGNITATADATAGQIVSLKIVAVSSTAAVSGSLPIMGASHTINATLSLGSVSTTTSSFDPGTQTKNIGDTGVRFTAFRLTAGSAEDLKLYSLRWRQAGTASASDLGNVITNVNGTDYPTVIDSTGKYYTTTFSGGLLISKGNSVDVYVKGNIVGGSAASRTVRMDIDKATDVYLVGQTYGYGVAAPAGSTPWWTGNTTTVAAGTATTIGKANEVSAQNIAVNVPNQPLGGFVTDFKGEAVSITGMTVTLATSTAATGLLTNVTISDNNGVVVAGPVDATWSGGSMVATFTDTVTFPVGYKVYTIKGKIPSGASNGAVITANTTPSSWTSPTGQTSANTITISQGNFTMNAMTVKAASLAVAISPSAQNIVAGAQGVEFTRVQFDASQSGEDIRLSSFALTEDGSGGAFAGAANKLSTCQISDTSGVLTGGSNVVNPSATATTSATTATFTLDNQLTIAKGTVKELSLKCNVASSADSASTFQWGISAVQIAAISATGNTSGNSVTATGADNYGQLMTVSGNGSLVVSTDSSSPSYTLVAGGSNVIVGAFKLRATNETVNLSRIGLKLTNTASSSASDLTQVQLQVNGVTIGTATFVGSNMNATSTLNSPLVLTRDTDVTVVVKADIASIGTSQPGTTGHLVAIDVDTNGSNTQGSGAQSGATVNASGSTAVSGVRIFKSFPTLAKVAVPTNTLNNGTQSLLRFTVTSNAKGDIGVGKVTLRIATTSASVTDVNVYAYTDSSFSTPVSGLRSDGALVATDILATGNSTWVSSATDLDFVATSPVQVPLSGVRYFEVRGTVANAITGSSVQTSLQGDAAFPALAGFDGTLSAIDSDTNDDFIWSPNTTGTAVVGDADWINGFGLIGLPSSNMSSEVLSK
jgi:hypothetical protein